MSYDPRPRRRPRKKSNSSTLIIILAVGGGLGLLLCTGIGVFIALPMFQQARHETQEAARRSVCKNNLKQIGLVMQNFHDRNNQFPPAFLVDKATGKPMHSWRVLILREMPGYEGLYNQYRLNEPWNGPNNSKLASQMPDVYRCPSSSKDSPMTHYVVVTGERTLFPGAEPLKFRDAIDGTSNTLLVVESVKPVHWMSPADPTQDEFVRQIREGGGHHSGIFHGLMANGAVHRFKIDLREQTLNNLIERNDKGTVEDAFD